MKQESFRDFDAITLYCPRCQKPVTVRKRLFLVLPGGDKYQYTCSNCGERLGSKMDKHQMSG